MRKGMYELFVLWILAMTTVMPAVVQKAEQSRAFAEFLWPPIIHNITTSSGCMDGDCLMDPILVGNRHDFLTMPTGNPNKKVVCPPDQMVSYSSCIPGKLSTRKDAPYCNPRNRGPECSGDG